MPQIPANLVGIVTQRPRPPVVLLIEPDDAEADRIALTLSRHYEQDRLTHVGSIDQALSLDLDAYTLALCAMGSDGAQGMYAIEELLLVRPDLPIIALAGHADQSRAAEAMREGAYDYVVKTAGYLHALPVVIEKNLTLHQFKQENVRLQVQLTATLGQLRSRNHELHRLVNELKTIASTDALTGIANRRALTQTLDQQFAHAQRHNTELALIAIDLDGFKQLNDCCGHPSGDRVLMLVARVLSSNARASDVAGRVGGDEFILVLPDTDPAEAMQVAKRIQSDFCLAFTSLAPRLDYHGQVTLSAGIATRGQVKSSSATELLASADRALYRAKNAGRSCVVMHGEFI